VPDITAELLSKVCKDVVIESPLQPLSGEALIPQTANRQDDARADIHARGFWGRQQCAFFDVRVFHPNARATVRAPFLQFIDATSFRRKGSMKIAFVKWSLHHSHLCRFSNLTDLILHYARNSN